MSQFLRGYLLVPIFIAAAVGLVAVLLGLGSLLRPRRPSPQKAIPYESGVDPVGDGFVEDNRVRVHARPVTGAAVVSREKWLRPGPPEGDDHG